MDHGLSSIVHSLFYKRSAVRFLLDQRALGRELHLYFYLLETAVVPTADQSFASEIHAAIAFVFDAQIVIKVHAALDDLAAAIAFDFEDIVSFVRFGGPAAEEVLEEAHVTPFHLLLG
jgi:hypothetical protein